MNCILYLTDFTERSTQALGFLLPVADELRARIIFVHLIEGHNASPKQKVSKSEEKEFLPLFNQLKQSVVMYGYKNNCEMLTGHLLLKGDLVANIRGVVKTLSPYAIIFQHDFSKRSRLLPGNIYEQLINAIHVPLMIIPASLVYNRISSIGYFSGVYKQMQNGLNDLLYKMRMFKSKLFAYYLPEELNTQSVKLLDEIVKQFPDAIDLENIHIDQLDPKYIGSRVDKIVNELEINLAAFNAGDKVFEDIFHHKGGAPPFLMKTPVLIYPGEHKTQSGEL